MSSQVIIRRNAGQEIPEDFFKLALENCPHAWGAATVQDGKLELHHGEKITLEALRETEANFGDFTLCLVNSPQALNLKNVPPYEIAVDKDDEPVIALVVDGDFPGFAKEKSTHPSSYYLADFVSDQVLDLLDNFDGDLAKVMEKIGGDRFKEKVKMNTVSRGFLNFICSNGREVTIAQGDTSKEFPWGWVSNTFGYGEKKKEEPAPKKKGGGLFGGRSTTREKFETPHQPSNNVVAAGADKAPPTETAVKAPPTPPPATPKPVALTLQNIVVKQIAIPGHLSRKLAKRWIKDRIGHIPPNYQEEGAKFNMYIGPDGKNLTIQEVQRALGMTAASLPKLENPKAPNQKDIEPKNIDSSKVVSNPLPIVSPASRERFQRYFSDERVKKIIAENGDLITDPDNVQGYEGKIPPFAEQLQMKDMRDFDALPFLEFEAIGRTNIHDLACACYAYKQRALKAELRLSKYEKKETKETKQEVQSEAPKSGGGLFKKRAAA